MIRKILACWGLSETAHAAASVATAEASHASAAFHAASLWCVATLLCLFSSLWYISWWCKFTSLAATSIASAELTESVAKVEHDVAVD